MPRKKYVKLRGAFRRKISQYSLTRENLFRLFENLNCGIFMVDLQGRFVLFNREAERITGYGRKEIFGHHFRKLLSLDDLSDGFKLFYAAVQGSYPQPILFRLLKKDRSNTIVEIQAAPFHLDRNLRGLVAFVRDIRERKKIEEGNQERVQGFIQLSKDLEAWHQQVSSLKKEVNALLSTLGEKAKYPLQE